MPFKDLPSSTCPDDETTIWRYGDIAKFLSLLHARALHFVCIKELKRTDPSEGAISEQLQAAMIAHLLPPRLRAEIGDQRTQIIPVFDNVLLVNSWQANTYESDALWTKYGCDHQGVAIRSTIGHLKAALCATPHDVNIRTVNYIDDATEEIAPENLIGKIAERPFRKTMYFHHENEVRALCLDPDRHRAIADRPSHCGAFIGVDVPTLIERVVVGAKAPKWLPALIGDVGRKYDLQLEVDVSAVGRPPNL